MIIICNEKEVSKKKLKNIPKIVVSLDIKELPDDSYQFMNQFLPEFSLFHDYLNRDISKKKYMKKYIETIKENDQLMASLTLLMMIYKENKNMAFVCSQNEIDYMYISFLMKIINEKFDESSICMYKEWKDNDYSNSTTLDKKKLKKLMDKYHEIIFEGEEEISEKPNKKKKKKKTEKDKEYLENLEAARKDDFIKEEKRSVLRLRRRKE